jgi:hypothetical protein
VDWVALLSVQSLQALVSPPVWLFLQSVPLLEVRSVLLVEWYELPLLLLSV